jgi:CRP/FNR family transcriptional regulator, cyclic AMP receptor protein
MSKKETLQDVSVLATSKNGLHFLTANDWALIADKAARVQFKAGDVIVRKGKSPDGLYLLVKGAAAAQLTGLGKSIEIGPGEVCGEISFIDERPATVDVVARQTVDALYLDRPTVQSLFELFPHLGSRFYRSLASSLSRRLRELIGP